MLRDHIAHPGNMCHDSDLCNFKRSNINIKASVVSIVAVSTIKNFGYIKT